jgi:hypothetical protein
MRSVIALAMIGFVLPSMELKKEDREFFEQRIQPILRDVCLKCHGGERIRNNLDVSTREDLLRGGDHGPAIVPGDPDKSLLIKAVRYQDNLHMPPKGKMEADKLADLAEWVKRGAPWPAK